MVVFENTHPAIIDRATWDLVQKGRQSRRRLTKIGDMGMFSGIVFCADCGNKLQLCRTTSWDRHLDNYVCGTYKRKRGECSAHYIRSVVLETLVLENLQKVIAYVKNYVDDFARAFPDMAKPYPVLPYPAFPYLVMTDVVARK